MLCSVAARKRDDGMLPRRGFTLVELLVVIAIIGVLVALLLPAVQAAREAARRTQCTNNAKQLALALQTHHDARKAFPPGIDRDETGQNGKVVAAWSTHLLPYLEQSSAHDAILWDRASRPLIVYDQNLESVIGARNDAFRCPSSTMTEDADPSPKIRPGGLRFGTSNYRGCRGIRDNAGGDPAKTLTVGWRSGSNEISALIGVLYPTTNDRLPEVTTMRQITDGTAHTIAIGEVDEVPHVPALQGREEAWRTGSASDDGGTDRWPTWPGSHGDKDDVLFNMWDPVRSSINSGDRDCASSSHPGGVNFGFCDGSVQ
ncbi:MAG: DUF1559 domain-containing protein, partial [Planctomycetota bacterium]